MRSSGMFEKLSRMVFSCPPLGKNEPPGTNATSCSSAGPSASRALTRLGERHPQEQPAARAASSETPAGNSVSIARSMASRRRRYTSRMRAMPASRSKRSR